MSSCPYCGSPIRNSDITCPSCSATLKDIDPITQEVISNEPEPISSFGDYNNQENLNYTYNTFDNNNQERKNVFVHTVNILDNTSLNSSVYSVLSLIFSIIGLLFFPFFGIPGISLAVKAKKQNGGKYTLAALGGLILGIMDIVIIIVVIYIIIFVGTVVYR